MVASFGNRTIRSFRRIRRQRWRRVPRPALDAYVRLYESHEGRRHLHQRGERNPVMEISFLKHSKADERGERSEARRSRSA